MSQIKKVKTGNFAIPVVPLVSVRRQRRWQNKKRGTGLAPRRQSSPTLLVLLGGEVWQRAEKERYNKKF